MKDKILLALPFVVSAAVLGGLLVTMGEAQALPSAPAGGPTPMELQQGAAFLACGSQTGAGCLQTTQTG
jgi:hypothetical protein